MDYNKLATFVLQYIGLLGISAASVAAAAFGLFKWLGGKWLEGKFAERLQNLKSEQDHAIRIVQSTIDREIHRAKKLYDNEFTALSESWRLLRTAYDMSAGTMLSMTTNVALMNAEELERYLSKRGMEEWQRKELRALNGEVRQDEYWKWPEWQRLIECKKKWRECQQQIDATSIFFPVGFTEKFRTISDMICTSNVEYEERIRQHKVPQYNATYDRFKSTKKLLDEGKILINELEGMVRDKLWSVAKEGSQVEQKP
ncbi:Uncharacterized protein ChrSV_2790 [Chromobacterium vaccinii]|nr:Uncharacterized protein ChrSW_2790 [Chromobacterium vaccinii]QND90247.1 Uncharacterized protein ChrSV_2790 [Chromobacterium vaccinii]